MRKNLCILFVLIHLPLWILSQDLRYPNRPFQPYQITGEVELGGGYRYQESFTNQIYNVHETPVLYGGLKLYTSSYILNPGIMIFDLGGEYNPEIRREEQIVVPNRTESRTIKAIETRINLLQGKPVNMTAYAKYSDGFSNRENITNINNNSLDMGGVFSWKNKYIPIRVSYDQSAWEQSETDTDRKYTANNKKLQATIEKSFSDRDLNEFIYFHRDYIREDENTSQTRNISDNFALSNRIHFDKEKKYLFRSYITGTDQVGTNTFKRLMANENLSIILPAHLTLKGNYTYVNNKRESQYIQQHNVRTNLNHQLYKSLTSSVYYELNRIRQSYYLENRNKFGIEAHYKKKIPTNGSLSISGEYSKQIVKHQSESLLLNVLDEQHLLRDGEIELLDRPNIIISSILVKDPTGTIIYQEHLDYVLIEQNVYVEIQRIPGGQIPNNSPILVDYTSLQEGTYSYHLNLLRLQVSVQLFQRLINVYYRWSQQDYNNKINTENVTLNYVFQRIYGIKLDYKIASVGVEYDNYHSNINPFNLWRYFIQLNGRVKRKLVYSFSGNYREYNFLYTHSYQKYADIKANFTYEFNPRVKLSLEAGYRNQIGDGIDLELFTGRLEFNLVYRELILKAGVELYSKTRYADDIDYYNVYIKLTRTFNWYK